MARSRWPGPWWRGGLGANCPAGSCSRCLG
jgi:hypothetical protein